MIHVARSPVTDAGPARLLRRLVAAAAWLALAIVLACWAGLAWAVDRHWLGTLVGLGPRWLLFSPVLVLLPLSVFGGRTAQLVTLCGAAIAIGPGMDFRIPWQRIWPQRGNETAIRVLTCNVAGERGLAGFMRLVEREQPLIVACQEWPAGVGWPLAGDDWSVIQHGGLLVASRYPVVRTATKNSVADPWRSIGLACELQTPHGGLRCVCVHLMSPRQGLEAWLAAPGHAATELAAGNAARREESRALSVWVHTWDAQLVLGDFNLVRESAIYASDWFDRQNAFSAAGCGLGYTKWTRAFGARIDHVLCPLGWHCRRAWVSQFIGSDHRPLFADVEFAIL